MNITTLKELLVDAVESGQKEIKTDERTINQVQAVAYIVSQSPNNGVNGVTREEADSLVELVGRNNELSGKNALVTSFIQDDTRVARLFHLMAQPEQSECDDDTVKALVNLISQGRPLPGLTLYSELERLGQSDALSGYDYTQPFITAINVFDDKNEVPEMFLADLMNKLPWDAKVISSITDELGLDELNTCAAKRIAENVREQSLDTNRQQDYADSINMRQSL